MGYPCRVAHSFTTIHTSRGRNQQQLSPGQSDYPGGSSNGPKVPICHTEQRDGDGLEHNGCFSSMSKFYF
eukprot:5240925-Amphidinium_carterae.1